jgi:hypothetical protein
MRSCRTVQFLADKWAKYFFGQKWMFMVQYMIYGISHLLCKNELKIWNKAGVDSYELRMAARFLASGFFMNRPHMDSRTLSQLFCEFSFTLICGDIWITKLLYFPIVPTPSLSLYPSLYYFPQSLPTLFLYAYL